MRNKPLWRAAKWDRNGVQHILQVPKKSLGTKSTEMTEINILSNKIK
jgi:hypothetical protein